MVSTRDESELGDEVQEPLQMVQETMNELGFAGRKRNASKPTTQHTWGGRNGKYSGWSGRSGGSVGLGEESRHEKLILSLPRPCAIRLTGKTDEGGFHPGEEARAFIVSFADRSQLPHPVCYK